MVDAKEILDTVASVSYKIIPEPCQVIFQCYVAEKESSDS